MLGDSCSARGPSAAHQGSVGSQAKETNHRMQTTAPAWCFPTLSLALAPGLQHPGLSAALLELVHCSVTSSLYLSWAPLCPPLWAVFLFAAVAAAGWHSRGWRTPDSGQKPWQGSTWAWRFCFKRSAHKFGYGGKSCSGSGRGKGITSISLNFSQAVFSHTL